MKREKYLVLRVFLTSTSRRMNTNLGRFDVPSSLSFVSAFTLASRSINSSNITAPQLQIEVLGDVFECRAFSLLGDGILENSRGTHHIQNVFLEAKGASNQINTMVAFARRPRKPPTKPDICFHKKLGFSASSIRVTHAG